MGELHILNHVVSHPSSSQAPAKLVLGLRKRLQGCSLSIYTFDEPSPNPGHVLFILALCFCFSYSPGAFACPYLLNHKSTGSFRHLFYYYWGRYYFLFFCYYCSDYPSHYFHHPYSASYLLQPCILASATSAYLLIFLFFPFHVLVTSLTLTPSGSSNDNRSPSTSKRIKTSVPANAPSHLLAPQQVNPYSRVPSYEGIPMPQTQIPPPNPRKRRASPQAGTTAAMPASGATGAGGEPGHEQGSGIPEPAPKKKGRTNTPWTAEEEQRLKTMRDAGRSWSEIAKVHQSVLYHVEAC